MSEEVKTNIIAHIEWKNSQIVEMILVKDWTCTSGSK